MMEKSLKRKKWRSMLEWLCSFQISYADKFNEAIGRSRVFPKCVSHEDEVIEWYSLPYEKVGGKELGPLLFTLLPMRT
jgi:hypothetical protein